VNGMDIIAAKRAVQDEKWAINEGGTAATAVIRTYPLFIFSMVLTLPNSLSDSLQTS
jgi:hypothetical protein